MLLMVEKGQSTAREALLRKLVDMQYERAEDLRRGTFRVRGDRLEIYPPYEDNAYAVELWGAQVDAIRQIDPLTGEVRSGQNDLSRLTIYPKSHYVMPAEQRERAIRTHSGRARLVEAGAGKAGQIRGSAARVAAHHV